MDFGIIHICSFLETEYYSNYLVFGLFHESNIFVIRQIFNQIYSVIS